MTQLQTKRITLIGIGLIGGSLALALKKAHPDIHITAFSRRKETLEKAASLGMLDVATTELWQAVKQADLVVLCTPLSTYPEIMQQVSAHLKPDAVITDVGSVKLKPTVDVINQLSHAMSVRFVPGHPIAGTEKSGPEAAFPELFQHKKTILSPLPSTQPDALQLVQTMWSTVGAQVELLDHRRHDFVYASVSHAIQFFSSSYMLLLAKLPEAERQAITAAMDSTFQQFIRLGGSDAVMWRDIFLENRHYLLAVVDDFLLGLSQLQNALNHADTDTLAARFQAAVKKRHHFRTLREQMGLETTTAKAEARGSYAENLMPYMDYMPRLIACFMMEAITEPEYPYATSAGLHGVTRHLLFEGSGDIEDMVEAREKLSDMIKAYVGVVRALAHTIAQDDAATLQQQLVTAQATYRELTNVTG